MLPQCYIRQMSLSGCTWRAMFFSLARLQLRGRQRIPISLKRSKPFYRQSYHKWNELATTTAKNNPDQLITKWTLVGRICTKLYLRCHWSIKESSYIHKVKSMKLSKLQYKKYINMLLVSQREIRNKPLYLSAGGQSQLSPAIDEKTAENILWCLYFWRLASAIKCFKYRINKVRG